VLRPSPSELLSGVADALEQTVLGELERGVARNQVMAAVGIVRRCAAAVWEYGPVLHADCVDVSSSLREIVESDGGALVAVPGVRERYERVQVEAERVLGSGYPSVVALGELALELREVVALVAAEVERRGQVDAGAAVRALLVRMLEREEGVGLSPW